MAFLCQSPRVVLFVVLAVSPVCCLVTESPSAGSSVVVLVDFSKSFAPLSSQDKRALQEVSAATAELARQEWQPPVAVLWSRIQTASLVASPLCGPFQFQQSLIKRDNDDSAQIAQKLEDCSNATVRASTLSAEQAPYTDISGAIALAVQQSEGRSAKYLIIISDFIEDLPPGQHPVTLQLNGERVLLLHRTGTERAPMAVVDHLARVRKWSDALRQAGASSVVALPLNSVTCRRVMRALGTSSKIGTDVVVLQDLPDTASPAMLKTIAGTLSKAARDWDSPVTVTWVDMRDEPNPPWQMPPLEFTSSLIKASAACHAIRGFPALLDECAEAMQRFSPGAKNGDIAASLKVYASAGVLDAQHIFLIVSSFPDLRSPDRDLSPDLSGVKVVMMPAPNREDASDESAYLKRVANWQRRLKEQHANICRIPFNGLTGSSLFECIHGR